MNCVWGWMGGPGEAGADRHIIDAMGGKLQAAEGSFQDLAVSASARQVSIHEAEGVRAVLLGLCHWDDAELDSLSREQGGAVGLVAAWHKYGAELPARLHGTFALVVLDKKANSTLLAIDRAGVHGMCYADLGNACAFASTADSVAAHPMVGAALDDQAIFNYLYFHMVPSPGTIYRNVRKLLPGEYVLFSGGRSVRNFYWRMPYVENSHAGFSVQAEQFRAVLRDGVSRSLAGALAPGAFLSGGTDSSTVSGLLTQVRGKPAETYSIGFDAEGFDEIAYARIAARHFGTHPHEYYVTPDDVVKAIPLIAAAYDEPFGNASAVPTYYCAKRAQEDGVDVMLAGDGGDEIFGGNARYAKQKVFEIYGHIPEFLRRTLIEPAAFRMPGAAALLPFRKLQSYINQAKVPLPDRLESYNFLHLHPLAEIFTADFLQHIDEGVPLALVREPYERADARSSVNRMMHLDLKQTLADNDLRKVNRMCALAGVEVRYPMLDEAVLDFSAQLPPEWKVKGLRLRYFFKEALRDFLPPETLRKSKQGFGLPFGIWMERHKPLQELAYDSLNAFRSRGYVQPAYIDKLIDQHRSGHASYYGVMIWVLMMLEQWLAAHAFAGRGEPRP
jgi:asparagine synthase (glutamine-hydrolysing)